MSDAELHQGWREQLAPLYAELDRVMPHIHGPTVDRLRTMFAIHIQFESQQVRLFLSHISAAYDWTHSPGARPYGRNERLKAILRECLVKGMEEGDIRPDVDPAETLKEINERFAAVPFDGTVQQGLSGDHLPLTTDQCRLGTTGGAMFFPHSQ